MWRSFITIGALVGLTACGDGNPFTEQATDETTGPLTVNGTELNEFLTGDGFAYNDNGTADPSDDTMIVNNIAFDNSDTSGGDYTFQRALPSGFSLYESPLLNIPDERRFFAVFKRSEHAQTTTVATNDYIGFGFQAGYTWPVATKQTLRLGVDLTRLNRLDSDVRSSDNVTVWARRSILLDNNSQMSVRASLTDIDSRSASVAHSAEFIGLVYALGKPVATAFWAFAFDVRRADFDDSAFTFLDPQEDTQYIFSASATFPELDVLGFAPVIEFRHERNHQTFHHSNAEHRRSVCR